MRFKTMIGNPHVMAEAEDLCRLLRLLLESAGHEVDFDYCSYAHDRACYLLLDPCCFGSEGTLEWVRAYGQQIIVVAREWALGDRYRDFPATLLPPGGQHDADGHLRLRNFRECARYARALWCLGPGQEEVYRESLQGKPAWNLPYPFFPDFPRVCHREEKDIDVFFSGTPTPHRAAIVAALDPRCHARVLAPRSPQYLRGEQLARARICLALKQAPAWPFPAPLRYWHALNNGCCLVRESCAIPCELDPYLPTADAANIPAACLELLASGHWKALADDIHQRFAAGPPCRPAAERLLDLTFGPSFG